MLKTIDTEVLIKEKLNAHEYIVLCLLFEQKYFILDDYLKSTNTYERFSEIVNNLASKSLIHFNPENSPYVYKTIVVSIDSVRKLGNYTNFEALHSLYPVKVRRPDGKETFLRKDKRTAEQIYNMIVKGNQDIHNHIMKCLKLEIKDRTAKNNLAYMKTLTNWLSDKEWKEYEDIADDLSYKTNKYLYGTDIE